MTRSTILRCTLAAGMALSIMALGACNKKPETQAQAGGEILEGSVSDAMLPLDTATSQPPLAPKTVTSAGDKGDGEDTAGDGEKAEAAPEAPAEAAPKAPAANPQ